MRATKHTYASILRDPATWYLERGGLEWIDCSYDDHFGTVEEYDLEFLEKPELLRECSATIIIDMEDEDHADYAWIMAPAHMELQWTATLRDDDDPRVEYAPELVSDLELKSINVNIVSRSQIIVDLTYIYHNEIRLIQL